MPGKKYDWDEWFGRPKFVVRKGRDFDCSMTSMAQQIRSEASLRGVPISIAEKRGSLAVNVGGDRAEDR